MPPRKNRSKAQGEGSAKPAAGTKARVKVAKGEQSDSIPDLNSPSTSAPQAAAAATQVCDLGLSVC